ncbi:hypothetical protein [Flaviaesturariibacter amylovorans]|uniref:DUF4348 domain-containing protein n=1 Tax=Flaviaesturariibacter amylovorans TaxID=1084520 RepID=A0ABP8HFK6_9BACT
MKKQVFLLLSALFFLASCSTWQERPADPQDIARLNEALDRARSEGAAWTTSPARIARHLFPPVAHSGSRSYSINERGRSGRKRRVTVVEEGRIGSGLRGLRHRIRLRSDDDGWHIVSYDFSEKR